MCDFWYPVQQWPIYHLKQMQLNSNMWFNFIINFWYSVEPNNVTYLYQLIYFSFSFPYSVISDITAIKYHTCDLKPLWLRSWSILVQRSLGHCWDQWASCHIRKMAFCACIGNAGNVVSDPDMHHGTRVSYEPWCMSGSLTSCFLWNRWRGKHSRHSRCMRNPQFYKSGKRTMVTNMPYIRCFSIFLGVIFLINNYNLSTNNRNIITAIFAWDSDDHMFCIPMHSQTLLIIKFHWLIYPCRADFCKRNLTMYVRFSYHFLILRLNRHLKFFPDINPRSVLNR